MWSKLELVAANIEMQSCQSIFISVDICMHTARDSN